MKTLTRQEVLTLAPTLARETLDIPEWKGSIIIQELTASERDAWEIYNKTARDKGEPVNIRASLAVWSVCDEQGNALFTRADIPTLGKHSAKILDRIWDVATRINGIGKDGDAEIKNS